MVIIMLGAPGTDKGTVSAILKEKLEIAHVSSGDIFRKYSSEDSELGREINSYLQQGKLVPDELTIKMIKERLNEKDVEKGVILDGFPRTEAQAVALDKMLSETGKKVDLVVDLDSPKQDDGILAPIHLNKEGEIVSPINNQVYIMITSINTAKQG